ncbi:NAD(P)-binding domain-containing protein [Acidisoma cellulosilytica]|uniref:Glycerol-3-phosphate dehydrogenase n=1 Tax=Acidisoma cellulosilyticum TaxID=2802395 RepID=A0A964E3E4_9PROT|nr:NAD(P)H-dependent glycerol-3-phosphate dehydrogenase [Acidisoma cellulosilyticum]MCB8880620.1 NAD(P)-binding domain-containing protein [Acidisoma cellulosilyticum]
MVLTTGTLSLLIMGYGAFGQALAGALHRRGDIAISVFSRNPPTEAAPRASVSTFIHDLRAIDLGAFDVVILALPSGALASVLDQLPPHRPRAVILSCVKGMDAETHDFPTDLIAKHLPGHTVGMLSGPTFASEMLAGQAVWMSLGCVDGGSAQGVADRLAGPLLSLTPTTDLRGLEIIGVAKNIIAIGAGLTEGLGLGANTRASYVARGIQELSALLPALGGKAETVLSPGGLGDLILTCTSAQSRNYRFGQDLGLRLASQPKTASGPVPLAEGSRSITAFLAFIRRSGAASRYFDGLAAAMANPDSMADRLTATIG